MILVARWLLRCSDGVPELSNDPRRRRRERRGGAGGIRPCARRVTQNTTCKRYPLPLPLRRLLIRKRDSLDDAPGDRCPTPSDEKSRRSSENVSTKRAVLRIASDRPGETERGLEGARGTIARTIARTRSTIRARTQKREGREKSQRDTEGGGGCAARAREKERVNVP